MTTKSSDNTTLSGQTGTGNYVGATSPSLVTPALGTPASGTLTNCTGLPVAGGGTGVASLTTYAVICGGTTTTGAVQSIASVGTSGQVLTSNGAGALPTFQAAGASSGSLIAVQIFNASGTYTPTAQMSHCIVQCLGGGAAGGGTPLAVSSSGGGGGAGGFSQSYVSAATIGASQAVTIGAGGTGVSGANGNNGNDTSVGSIVIAKGGTGGLKSTGNAIAGSLGGVAGTGDLTFVGGSGSGGIIIPTNTQLSGAGGSSYFSCATPGVVNGGVSSSTNGNNATANSGAGGSGAANGGALASTGGNGGSGIVIIYEYK